LASSANLLFRNVDLPFAVEPRSDQSTGGILARYADVTPSDFPRLAPQCKKGKPGVGDEELEALTAPPVSLRTRDKLELPQLFL
jgi:hypothetical protein